MFFSIEELRTPLQIKFFQEYSSTCIFFSSLRFVDSFIYLFNKISNSHG